MPVVLAVALRRQPRRLQAKPASAAPKSSFPVLPPVVVVRSPAPLAIRPRLRSPKPNLPARFNVLGGIRDRSHLAPWFKTGFLANS